MYLGNWKLALILRVSRKCLTIEVTFQQTKKTTEEGLRLLRRKKVLGMENWEWKIVPKVRMSLTSFQVALEE